MKGKYYLILPIALTVLSASVFAAPASAHRVFVTHLTGDKEVPSVDTLAQGQAVFMISHDETMIRFVLIAANIKNVLMSHIHMAPKDENGPIVVWLYPSMPPPVLIPGRFNGVLAMGTITSANLVGPLAGQPLSALISAMEAGKPT